MALKPPVNAPSGNDALFALRRSISNYGNGGMLLIIVTVFAMLIANSSLRDLYFSWWEYPVYFQVGDLNLFSHHGEPMSLMQFINDALMAVFFFSIGLEIKREVLVGELSSVKQALLPVIAALGGMLFPILIFRLLAHGNEEVLRGSAIPMATDIAFSLGILSMLGRRVPIALKVFLATLAVADDIGGILVIALFYSGKLHLSYLLYAALLLILLGIGGYKRINSKLFYLGLGAMIWFMFLNSGVHSTIAGVLIAFCVPARPRLDTCRYIERIRYNIAQFPVTSYEPGEINILTKEQINLLKSVESASDRVISPLQSLEDSLHPLVNYLIIPLFAFANAGISLEGMEVGDIFKGAGLGVFAGLVLGKMIGIFAFSFLTIKLKLAGLPRGTNWMSLLGVSLLGGIGFTVSIFIATLSYGEMPEIGAGLLKQAKLGILMGSLVSGLLGYSVLNSFLPHKAVDD